MGGVVEAGTGSVGRRRIAEEGEETVGGTAWGRGWALLAGRWDSIVEVVVAGLQDLQGSR